MVGDEETGAVAAVDGTAAAIEAHPSTTSTKSWITATHRNKAIVGAAAILVLSTVALALSIGLSTSGNDDGDDEVSEAAASGYESTHPKIPDGDHNNTADYGDEPKGSSLSENNGMASEGESAGEKIPCPCPVPRPQMAWPPWLDSTSEAASATLSDPVGLLLPSSTPAPSTNNPSTGTTDEPTTSHVTKPTEQPFFSPTVSPVKRPSSEPSKQPTTTAPTFSPTWSPTVDPTPSPVEQPIASPTASPSTTFTPMFGDELITNEELGIRISRGISARLVAKTGEPVQYANGTSSTINYHSQSDGAGIVALNPSRPLEDGYVYVANSERGDGRGGVYGVYFDRDGNVMEYKALLTDTTDNCGGGLTPWNSWLSCEEYESGQCWQVDPIDGRVEVTRLGGTDGGKYESVAVDNTDPMKPIFFTTEDDERGALRRFEAIGNGWDALHTDGVTTFLHIIDDSTFEWTSDEEEARDSAESYYPNSEGIQYHEAKLYFMSKTERLMLILDLENGTYETERSGVKLYGEGSFSGEPDQILFGPRRNFLYFTEDGGDACGVYGRYRDGTYFTLFESIDGVYGDDETVGIALSLDNRRFYAGIQDAGLIFEFTRDDGLPFE